MRAPRFLVKFIQAYESVQVELHGQYSVERVHRLHSFEHHRSYWQCLLVMLLTPLPCLFVITLADAVSLNPPEQGLAHSHMFWLRAFVVTLCISFTILDQCRRFLPTLPNSGSLVIAMTLITTSGSTAYAFMLSSFIGFPLPFTMLFASPSWCTLYTVCIVVTWGQLLRKNATLRHDLLGYFKVVIVQLSLTVVYPAFNFVFIQLEGYAQTAFALGLPIIKLLAKNCFNLMFTGMEDFKPEVVIFNCEVFHALFVSCCMQNSTSRTTTILLMSMDFVHAWSSLYDVDVHLGTIRMLEAKMDAHARQVGARVPARDHLSLIEKAMYYVVYDKTVRSNSAIRLEANSKRTGSILVPPDVQQMRAVDYKVAPKSTDNTNAAKTQQDDTNATANNEEPTEKPSHTHDFARDPALLVFRSTHRASTVNALERFASLSDDKRSSLGVLTQQERLRYVSCILKVLYMTEFLLLVEFVEVVIPVIYSVYLLVVFYLPNRIYYPQLLGMSTNTLQATIGSVLGYAGLEFLSFVAMSWMLRRKLQISPVHQLAFVLGSQWQLVQSKMVLWVLFAVQTSLRHFGSDYTFQFVWLKKTASEAT